MNFAVDVVEAARPGDRALVELGHDGRRREWTFGEVARGSVVPTFHLDRSYLTVLIGLIGTTITPWMQFYLQAAIVDKEPFVRRVT